MICEVGAAIPVKRKSVAKRETKIPLPSFLFFFFFLPRCVHHLSPVDRTLSVQNPAGSLHSLLSTSEIILLYPAPKRLGSSNATVHRTGNR